MFYNNALAAKALASAGEALEQIAALRACLEASGLVSDQRFQAEQHKRHFADVCSRYPLLSDTSFEDVSRGSFARIGTYLGTASPCLGELQSVSSAVAYKAPKQALEDCSYIVVAGGFDGTNVTSKVERYFPELRCWEQLPPLPAKVTGHCGCVVHGGFYIVGGFDPVARRNMNTGMRLDLATMKWGPLPPMTSVRFGADSAGLFGKFVVVGGNDGTSPIANVERIDWHTRQWEELPNMLQPRTGQAVGVLDGALYVAGGQGASQTLNTAEKMVWKHDKWTWTRLPGMRERRFGAAAAVVDGCFYVCGGEMKGATNLKTVERFDPKSARWEEIAPMQRTRFGARAVGCLGSVFVLGGNEHGVLVPGPQRLRCCEELRPPARASDSDSEAEDQSPGSRGTWSRVPVMSRRRGGFAAGVVEKLSRSTSRLIVRDS
eukprot:TRINITY_DN17182_c0_g1_i1.p1 TRINITY_DN17182_c0_g1~~TRINITY_DN17182_c0_g1_i1.p1  ORF type:complete len:433 (-),score=54.72 TRINITY_DN17182_c0_g1_i1:291-1589(-)